MEQGGDATEVLDDMSSEQVHETIKAAEKAAEEERRRLEEERRHIEHMPGGPKKMLKMKALKAASLKAKEKQEEADKLKEYEQKRQEAHTAEEVMHGGWQEPAEAAEGGLGVQSRRQVQNPPATKGTKGADTPNRALERTLPLHTSQQFSSLAGATRSPIKAEVGDLKHRVNDLEKMIELQNSDLEKLMSKLDRSAGGSARPPSRRRAQAEAELAFQALDTNNDGVISREEWLAVYGNELASDPRGSRRVQ